MRAHGAWNVLHLERGLQEDIPDLVKRQSFDGVIARIENRMIADSVQQFGVPTVDLRGVFRPEGGVTFNTDPEACAAMAIEHFRQRGFRELAFCGYAGVDFSDDRRDAFLRICKEKNINAHVYRPDAATPEPTSSQQDHLINKADSSIYDNLIPEPGIAGSESPGTLTCELGGEVDEVRLAQWLTQLPKPVGVFACNDMRGRQVLGAIRYAGLRVPDQVAVLGVDNDEVICDLANPPLTSIEPDAHRIGFEGAAALMDLMSGIAPTQQKKLIPPTRLSVRMSTDVMAIDDSDLAAAVQFIRSNACDGIGVEDVLRATAYSRATLERRFRQILARTPREEIERVRIDRVRMLLAETTYSLEQIAHMVSYKTAAHLVTAFRRNADCTPGQYRRRFHRS
jgi:LacI family transcriptional regulator